jgi:lipid II:glycine glycyltransferase (peptidoglycan interpeptide bridge formation enzyme)
MQSTELLQTTSYIDTLKRAGKVVHTICTQDGGVIYAFEKQGFFANVLHIYRVPQERYIFDAVLSYAKKHSFDAVHIEPSYNQTKEAADISSWKKSTPLQPEWEWHVSLVPSLQNIWDGMHQKHRYNIRKWQSSGCTLEQKKDISLYWPLHEATQKRQGFFMGNKNILEKLLEDPASLQYTALLPDGKPLAGAIVYRTLNTAHYLYAASAGTHQKCMAPVGILWQAIQDAAKTHMSVFNCTGIASLCREAEENRKSFETYHGQKWDGGHPYSHVTRIKVGFPGTGVHHGKACVLPLTFRGKLLPKNYL